MTRPAPLPELKRRPGVRGHLNRAVNAIVAHPLPAVTIAGAITYALVRAALARFYGRFGVDPEEVGLGYTDVLVRATLGLGLNYVVLVALGAVLILFAVGAAADRPRGGPWTLRWATPALKAWLVVALPVLGLTLPFRSDGLADDVVAGRDVRPSRLAWPDPDLLPANPFGIRAEEVTVETLSGGDPGPLENCPCEVTYLGRANGVAVLYDVGTRRTIRVADSELVVVRTP